MLPPETVDASIELGRTGGGDGRPRSAEKLCVSEGQRGDSDTTLLKEVGDECGSGEVESATTAKVVQLGESGAGTDDVQEAIKQQHNEQRPAGQGGDSVGFTPLTAELMEIYHQVCNGQGYNFQGARKRVPSGLRLEEWNRYLEGYQDRQLVDYLAYGWPINFKRGTVLQSTHENHASARQNSGHVDFYINTELGYGALWGPFESPPAGLMHISPLMTRPKRDSANRRVIVDLSWPPGAAINEGVDEEWYIDGPATISLPTVDYLEERILQLGAGAYMYKTDLSRGYRQLRVDPNDWPLLGFQHEGKLYMDICPPLGLRSAAMCMQRTTEAISYIHMKAGFYSRPYLDDFGGAEASQGRAQQALGALQNIMVDLGVEEAKHKVCQPSQSMVWLGILFNTVEMTMKIPPAKLQEVMELVQQWAGRQRASQRDMQSLLGLLQFVASVAPPVRVFTNRILQDLREAPKRGTETLSLGFKQDLKFFETLLPHFNGIKIMDKQAIECQETLELDACLTGCGAVMGTQYYTEEFPQGLLVEQHNIARLEMLNIVVAVKVWARQWSGRRVRIQCDNTNACIAIQTGRSRDAYMQSCVRELFLWVTWYDIEVVATHCPGVEMVRADALSRAHKNENMRRWVESDAVLSRATRVRVSADMFELTNDM